MKTENVMIDLDDLKAKAVAATPCDLNTAEKEIAHDNYINCPICSGEGYVQAENEFVNIDNLPIGVEFYGIGAEFGANEKYFRAATPAVIIGLIDQLEMMRSQGAELLEVLKAIAFATSPDPDDGSHHENAYVLATEAIAKFENEA